MNPTPPQTCNASVVTFIAVSEAKVLALLASSRWKGSPDDAISPARHVSRRGGVDGDVHIGEHEADALVFDQGAGHGLAFAGVVGGVFEGGAGQAGGESADPGAGGGEGAQRAAAAAARKSGSGDAQAVIERDADIVEGEVGGVAGADAHFVPDLDLAEAGRIVWGRQRRRRRASPANRTRGRRRRSDRRCPPPVMKRLVPLITYSSPSRTAAGLDVGGVGAGVGFGQGPARPAAVRRRRRRCTWAGTGRTALRCRSRRWRWRPSRRPGCPARIPAQPQASSSAVIMAVMPGSAA